LPLIKKTKFLSPMDLTITQFMMEIRQHITLAPNQTLYLFVDDASLPLGSKSMAEVYNRHKNQDGFLYICYAELESFGTC